MAFGGLYQTAGVGAGRGRLGTPSERYAARAQQQTALRGREQTTTTKVAPQKPSAEVMGLFTEAMKKFQPGGTFGKKEEAMLARAKKRYLASSAQQMVSAGLSGTTVPMAEEAKFQEEIGEPTRLGLEDVRTSRLNELLMSKAGYLGGLSGRTTTTTATQRMPFTSGGGGGRALIGRVDPTGRAELSPTDFGATRERERTEKEALWSKINAPGFGARQIPEGGRITGDYYYPPPSSYTRNVPTLTR